MYRYHTYGIVIHSALEMAELQPTTSEHADLTIVFEELPHCSPPAPCPNYRLEVEPKWFVWKGLGRFELRDNKVLAIDRDPGVSDRYLTFAILGPIIAYVLHAKGQLVLHASAVAKDGQCIAFIAEKGTGKSTTAAACIKAGFAPLCDDVTAVQFEARGAFCAPGFAQVKLRHDAAAFLKPVARRMPEPMPDFSKGQFHFGMQAKQSPARLTHIYLLRRGPELALRPLQAIEALRELMGQAYISLYARRHAYVSPADRQRLLADCALLSGQAQVSEIIAPGDLGQLSNLVTTILNDAGIKSNSWSDEDA